MAIWFARHGYVCLVLDSLQLGEIAGIHHGTYREGRWWWHSRGYTPAGVECLNGMRGIDYLISRPDVDPERIAVTGISGGGAATFWIAAADERVKVAVPVSGMADLPSYVENRVINGHCDCMFLYNTFQWPWTRIAALIAPRPMLFTNSDQDDIFPMDANQRVINNLERLYSLYGAGDLVDSLVSIGGHAYRQDIRQAAYRFINMHLKNDPRVVNDSEVDLVTGPEDKRQYPIAAEKLRVFPPGLGYPEGSVEHDDRSAFRADGTGPASEGRPVRGVASVSPIRASVCHVRILPRANSARRNRRKDSHFRAGDPGPAAAGTEARLRRKTRTCPAIREASRIRAQPRRWIRCRNRAINCIFACLAV